MKKKCAVCNSKITSKEEYFLEGDIFCSHECLETATLLKDKDTCCAWCGKTWENKQDYIIIDNYNYCSPTCAIESQEEIICKQSAKHNSGT